MESHLFSLLSDIPWCLRCAFNVNSVQPSYKVIRPYKLIVTSHQFSSYRAIEIGQIASHMESGQVLDPSCPRTRTQRHNGGLD